MAREISFLVSEEQFRRLERAVARGRFDSREAAAREGLARILGRPEDAEIAEAYRQAYGRQPQDPALGEAGAKLMTEIIAADERRQP